MDLELKDKVAIVTGASRGIGEGIANVLAQEGADMFLVARSAEDLERVAAGIRSRTGRRTASAEFTIGGSVNSALVNFTKATGDIGRTEGVRVNAINPGHIQTSRLEKRIETAMRATNSGREAAIAHMIAELGINRFGLPEEIGRLVAFLASPKADFIHGTVIDMDGGETRAI